MRLNTTSEKLVAISGDAANANDTEAREDVDSDRKIVKDIATDVTTSEMLEL
jgi:hypothetical protein